MTFDEDLDRLDGLLEYYTQAIEDSALLLITDLLGVCSSRESLGLTRYDGYEGEYYEIGIVNEYTDIYTTVVNIEKFPSWYETDRTVHFKVEDEILSDRDTSRLNDYIAHNKYYLYMVNQFSKRKAVRDELADLQVIISDHDRLVNKIMSSVPSSVPQLNN